MRDDVTPIQYVIEAAKLKYKYASLPIFLIGVSFVSQMMFKIEEMKYLALPGIIFYLFVNLMLRVNRTLPEAESGIVSPVNGKVDKIEKNGNTTSIYIKKGFLAKIDVRASVADSLSVTADGFESGKVLFKVISGNFKKYENRSEKRSVALGFFFFAGRSCLEIKNCGDLEVKSGDKLISGVSVITKGKDEI